MTIFKSSKLNFYKSIFLEVKEENAFLNNLLGENEKSSHMLPNSLIV